ncbi:MAG: DNA starvation/stationary phase protection protein [Peptostreptococcaceae bacterium]|nr:DNA starvation/stationary phase protection protein [Peptostreptococcaceae bacterium]
MNEKLQARLNEYLANQQVMYIKLHNLHWYVKGQGFFTLHAKLEELYDQTADIIDEVAERILAIGGKPVASLKRALEVAKIKELSDEGISSDDTVSVLISDVEYLVKDTRAMVEESEEANDNGTADLFNGYLSEYQKLLWMLNAYRG